MEPLSPKGALCGGHGMRVRRCIYFAIDALRVMTRCCNAPDHAESRMFELADERP